MSLLVRCEFRVRTDNDAEFLRVARALASAAATEPGPDTWLHDTMCELKAARVWNIVLTPNYNADHRGHFHVDLTAGADYIRKASPIDSGPDDW